MKDRNMIKKVPKFSLFFFVFTLFLIIVFNFWVTSVSSSEYLFNEKNIQKLLKISELIDQYEKKTGESDFFKVLESVLPDNNMSIPNYLALRSFFFKKVQLYLDSNLKIDPNYKSIKDLLKSYISKKNTLNGIVKSEQKLLNHFISKTEEYRRWRALLKEQKRVTKKIELLNEQINETKGSETFVFNEEISYSYKWLKKIKVALETAEYEKKALLQSISPEVKAEIYIKVSEEIQGLRDDISELQKICLECKNGKNNLNLFTKDKNSQSLTDTEIALIKKYFEKMIECMSNVSTKSINIKKEKNQG